MLQSVTLVKEAIEKQGLKLMVFLISRGNVAEENGLWANGVRASVISSRILSLL